MREDASGFLIDRLALSIIDESLPLKDVEKELRGCVAEVAVKKRGLGKREVASRCGVTEKSIDNYLKEARSNPKSPEREISRLLQDGALSLEEIYEGVRPVLCHGRHFTLDDAKRALEKLIRTGVVEEHPGKRYRGSERPSITNPLTIDAYRNLVDEKARDMDYIILRQKEVTAQDLQPKGAQHFSRVVGDSNLVRIDFTVDVPEDELPDFYEKLSAEIARLTLKYEKKKGRSRVRVIVGMRAVVLLLVGLLTFLGGAFAGGTGTVKDGRRDSWELDSRIGLRPPFDFAGNTGGSGGTTEFIRGDVNLDRTLDLGDAIASIQAIMVGTPLACTAAADVNDDGRVTLGDPIRLLRYLFLHDTEGPGVPTATDSTSLPCEGLEAQ